jgi:GNAT superfamily N-acetyltransferase
VAGYRAVFHGGYVDVVKVRAREAADRAAAEGFLGRRGGLRVARLGELVYPLDHPAFVAETADGRLAGMLTYVPGQDWQQCEILTLHAGEQWHGAGTALIEAVGQLARRHGCARLWVITTNDNVDALRFYQRRGFCLVRVHRGAVDRSRAILKPEIPPVGAYEIPLRDEIELERQP